MFAEFKFITEAAVSAFKALAGQQKREWSQLGKLFAKIAESLDSMAAKYESGTVPRAEFISIQVYAAELHSCWQNMPLSGKS